MSTELTFVRHGQTEANRKGLYTGLQEVPLNAVGIGQAEEAARELRDRTFDVLAYGSSGRVRETADIIRKGLLHAPGVVLESDALREMNFGRFEGLTPGQIERKYPQEWDEYMKDWVHFKFPGGEDFVSFCGRCRRFICGLVEEYGERHILVVASKGPILCMLAVLQGEEIDHIFDRAIGNARPLTIRYSPRG